jgi:hypothetical protein
MIARRGKLAERIIHVRSDFVSKMLCVVIKDVFVKRYLHGFLEYL